MKQQQPPLIIALLTLGALGALLTLPTMVLGDELDDISIQVIGLDEIPEDALELIPMPSPDFGGSSDIRHQIIPHQIVNVSPPDAITDIGANPETGVDTTSPTPNQ